MRALQSKNVRLFFGGQALSLIGTWMTQVAAVWLVYELTNSPLLLGIVGFTDQIFTFFLAPFTGSLVDQGNRHRILLVTQTLAMFQSLALAFLVLTNQINIWYIIILSLFQGAINAFDVPTRQVFISEIVENKEDLGNAISLNSLIISSARLMGPAIAGITVATSGTGLCFLLDGMSYIAVIAALLAMNITAKPRNNISFHPWNKFKEGLAYTLNVPEIAAILLLLALVSFMAMPYTYFAPIFAKEILMGDSHTLGFLMSAAGMGSLTGSIFLIFRKTLLGLENILMNATASLGLALIIFCLSKEVSISLVMMFVVGLSLVLQVASSNIILQAIVEDDKRARIMTLFTIAYLGMIPLGNLASGVIASKIGTPNTLIINAGCCLLGAWLFHRQILPLRTLLNTQIKL